MKLEGQRGKKLKRKSEIEGRNLLCIVIGSLEA